MLKSSNIAGLALKNTPIGSLISSHVSTKKGASPESPKKLTFSTKVESRMNIQQQQKGGGSRC